MIDMLLLSACAVLTSTAGLIAVVAWEIKVNGLPR
jgi:hypothetical protein